jgi:hypothetical protein
MRECSNVKFPAINVIEIDIPIDRSILPVSQEPAVDAKIDELLEQDIIEPVDEPSGWVSPMGIIVKPYNEIRLCIDIRRANKAVIREQHPLPTVDDLLTKLQGSKYYSSLDIKFY